MSWSRWALVCVVATLGALIVSVGAGDFDRHKRDAARQAAINAARQHSGVNGVLPGTVEIGHDPR